VSERPFGCAGCAGIGHDPARRLFVAQGLLATLGLLAASACGDGVIGGPTGPRLAPALDPPLLVLLTDFPPLDVVGGIARVDGNSDTPVAVTRVAAAEYRAFSMICPHASYRPITIGATGFTCPNHGARFAADGDWTGGQRTSDLREYTVVFDAGAGTLTIS
jgi:Rieske Fe-S protein